jgi:hypothetical protein
MPRSEPKASEAAGRGENGVKTRTVSRSSPLRCRVFRGLPKELEEDVNKFLESTPVQIHRALQSESGDHVTLTLIYEIDVQGD